MVRVHTYTIKDPLETSREKNTPGCYSEFFQQDNRLLGVLDAAD